jgi:hypothetical protein
LDNELGVKWIEPGDSGIVYNRQKVLSLKTGSFEWTTKLVKRHIRDGMSWRRYKSDESKIPKEFRMSQREFASKKGDVDLWLKRMRMGESLILNYGHAFTRWWHKYGKAHPEYFALNKYGKRAPWSAKQPDRIKICVSNPAVHDQIVENWLKRRKSAQFKAFYETINVCENDSGGYCRCPKCMALDVRAKGEEFPGELTDRYIYFANAVLKKAQKQVPDAKVVMYAYSCYRFPPKKQNVSKGVILGFVPSMMELKKVENFYKGWQAKGACEMFLRPNDQHINSGLPMGFEKQLFDHFQLGIKYGIIGTDYDSMHNYWPASGIADYILARAHIDPSKPFEYWEDEYCLAFGPAKDDVKNYFRYWRNEIWNKRLIPNGDSIRKKGRYGNFRRGLMWDLPKYYRLSDFDKTDKILKAAASKKLSPAQKKRLDQLIIANEHARLTYQAICAKGPEKMKAASKLYAFRVKHKDDLNINWPSLMMIEQSFGDITGVFAASKFKGFSYYQETPLYWYFLIDQKNEGLKEKWQEYPWSRIRLTWDLVQTNTFWERLSSKRTHPKLKKLLTKYDGIGWYAQYLEIDKKLKGKKIYLMFGAVDESCWVYVNGQEAGKRIFKNDDDWKTPFMIQIDNVINWNAKHQLITVRVEDKAGAGGIWKPVAIVAK